jgi:hypothetical protein
MSVNSKRVLLDQDRLLHGTSDQIRLVTLALEVEELTATHDKMHAELEQLRSEKGPIVGTMTLRDHFAACALTGAIAKQLSGTLTAHGSGDNIAEYAYYIADAMLAERAKRGEK